MDSKLNIRTIVDYPKPGIRFRDISTLMQQPESFRCSIDRLSQHFQNTELDGLAAIDSRGFLFASAVAYQLHVPVHLIRKSGKLPGQTVGVEYCLEYGTGKLEMQSDAVHRGSQIVVIDDLIATGGTMAASIELLCKLGATVVECAAVVELVDLAGRQTIAPVPLFSLVTFREDEV